MTKPIHPSVAIACGDLLQHAMWVTSCSDVNIWVQYSAHVGWINVYAKRKDNNEITLCDFRLNLDTYDHELAVSKIQWAIDAITVHRGRAMFDRGLPTDNSMCDCVDPDYHGVPF